MMNNAISGIKLSQKSKALIGLRAIIQNEEEKRPGDAERFIKQLPNLLNYASNHATNPIRYYIHPAVRNTFLTLLSTINEALEYGGQPAEIHLTILKHFVKYLPDLALSIFHPTSFGSYEWMPDLRHLLSAGLVIPSDILKLKVSKLLNPDIRPRIYTWLTDAIEAGILNQFNTDAKNTALDLQSCRLFSANSKHSQPNLNHYVLELRKFSELKQASLLLPNSELRVGLMLKINALLIAHFEESLLEYHHWMHMINSIPGVADASQASGFLNLEHPVLYKLFPPAIAATILEYHQALDFESGQAIYRAEAKRNPASEADRITALAVCATRHAHLLEVLDKDTIATVEEYLEEGASPTEATESVTSPRMK